MFAEFTTFRLFPIFKIKKNEKRRFLYFFLQPSTFMQRYQVVKYVIF
jgi:hypothetical protein